MNSRIVGHVAGAEPSVPPQRPIAALRAVIFDVDGTLYRQAPLRRRLALALVRAYVTSPAEGLAVARSLAAYRWAQEQLRTSPHRHADLGAEQIARAAARAGRDPVWLRELVTRWLERAPLALLSGAAWPDAVNCLRFLRAAGLRLAIVSDYPADAKLRALGIDSLFDVIVSAHDRAVGRFKPSDAGINLALRRLGVTPPEAAYVGDRPEIDAPAAAAAGVECFIIGARSRRKERTTYRAVRDYTALAAALLARQSASLGRGDQP